MDAELLAENYTALELAELLVLALKGRDPDLVPGDGLCAGGYEDGQEKWPEYPEREEQWFRVA